MKPLVTITLLAAFLFSGCTRDENAYDLQPHEIAFTPVLHRTQTRVLVDNGTVYPQSLPLGAYAWYGPKDGDNTELYINDAVFSYDAGVNGWKSAATYYWPFKGDLDFFCYAPTIDAAKPTTVSATAVSYNDLTIGDHDILYSTKAVGQTPENSTNNGGYVGVPILFHHALAQIAFKVKTNKESEVKTVGNGGTMQTSWSIRVTNASISGIHNRGSLTLSQDATHQWQLPALKVWTPTAGVPTMAYTRSSPVAVTTAGADLLSPTLVMPQTLDDNVVLKLVYQVETTTKIGKTTASSTESHTASVTLNTIEFSQQPLTSWQMNKKIVYTLSINPAVDYPEITISPQVAPWDEVQGTPNLS